MGKRGEEDGKTKKMGKGNKRGNVGKGEEEGKTKKVRKGNKRGNVGKEREDDRKRGEEGKMENVEKEMT